MKPKVLLVEDNENSRYLATFLLEHAGFVVVAAANGKLALEMVSTEKPDIIVLDIQMPEMDGYETASRLKGDPRSARIPIVGVSSYAMPRDRERALRSGFAGYLEKPIDPERFCQTISSFLESNEGPDENPVRG